MNRPIFYAKVEEGNTPARAKALEEKYDKTWDALQKVNSDLFDSKKASNACGTVSWQVSLNL